MKLFDMYVDYGLDFVRSGEIVEEIVSVNQNLVASLANLFELLLYYYNVDGSRLPETAAAVDLCFIYAYTWSFGGNLGHDSRYKFDVFCRQLFHSTVELPPEGLIYDYCIDVNRKAFIRWENMIPSVDIELVPSVSSFDNIMIPTIDTLRYSHLMNVLITGNRPVLLAGPGGNLF